MIKIRQAYAGDIERQKEIWRYCFGDEENYLNIFYTEQYRAENTLVLLEDEEIAAMLTIISTDLAVPGAGLHQAAMLYAIATHPVYRSRGYASRLIDYTHQFLADSQFELALLVPAEKELFEFYYRRGYQESFYLREAKLTGKELTGLWTQEAGPCRITAIEASEYNRRRDEQLKGRLFLKYNLAEIEYQRRLSRQSGADIYAVDLLAEQGCLAVERISAEKVLLKELLIAEDCLEQTLRAIAEKIPAEEYLLRTPAHLGQELGGKLRAFGLCKVLADQGLRITPEDRGYLGLAFD